MAYIEKRKIKNGNFSYRVRIRQKGSPDVTQSFPTRTEATKWAQRMEADVRAGRYFGREESKERTFTESIDYYIDKELPKKKDFRKQKMQLEWWKVQFRKYLLCNITSSMIMERQELLRSEITKKGIPRSDSTTNRYMAALSTAYTTFCKKQWIKENPVLKVGKLKENKGRDRYLEQHEITRLLAACKNSKSPYIYAVTLFALCTGARLGELLGIKQKNLDLKRCTATFEDTKNGETRTVHLTDAVVECLTKELSKRTVLSEFVFPNKDGSKPADIRTGWENALKEAGLRNTGVCFHTLRHTAASFLAMKGLSLCLIGKILGHKSYIQTLRYSHLSTASTAPALNQLTDEFLGAFASG